jgi:hypothetical protein
VLLALSTDALAYKVSETTFGGLAELIVMGSFLADDEAPAVVARIEPFGGGGGDAARTIETDTGAHLDEGSALRESCRLLVFDADQGNALIVFEDARRADGDLVASFSLADGMPISCGAQSESNQQHWRERYYGKNEEGFFHLLSPQAKENWSHTLWGKKAILSIEVFPLGTGESHCIIVVGVLGGA